MKRLYTLVIMIITMIGLCGCSGKEINDMELADISGTENTHSYQVVEYYNYTKNIEDNYIDKVDYENPLDLSHLEDISFTINDQSIDVDINGTLGDIDTDCKTLITPVCNISDINNCDLISIDYIVTEDDIEKNAFSVVSYAIDDNNTEHIDFVDRKINYITAKYDNKMYVFDTLIDKKINTFIKEIGNPTCKYTNTIVDPYTEDKEKTIDIYSYVYKTEKFNLVLFSNDDVTIDRISLEIL